jgi:predicted S18 family serine protease
MATYLISIQRPNAMPQSVELSAPRVVLGREGGDLALNDPQASTQHCELLFDGARLVVRDLQSTNGTFFNGQRITETPLRPGQSISVGQSVVVLMAIKAAGGATPTPVIPGRGRTVVATPGDPALAPAPVPAPALPTAPPAAAAAAAPSSTPRALGFVLAAIGGAIAIAAVILVMLVVLKPFGRGGGSGSSSGGGDVTVKAVYFTQQPIGGGTSDVTLSIAPNPKGAASVGVMEQFAGGTGNQWRTATWLAAFNASQAAGTFLTDHEFLVKVGGHIDGPSAGMLMTASLTALLKGVPLRADTTMTGTINPDGSAGPVGGVVQKMEGAKAAGIKRFGYPMGIRNHVDMRTKQTVDLMAVGEKLGLEVHEIHDLDEAYTFLTGASLEHPAPLEESELELDNETMVRLKAKTKAWKARLDAELQQLKLDAQRSTAPQLAAALHEVSAQIEKADGYEKGDQPVAALQEYVRAELTAGVIRQELSFLQHVARGDLARIVSEAEASELVSGEIDAFLTESDVLARRKTLGGQLSGIGAYQAYVTADALAAIGHARLKDAAGLMKAAKAGQLDTAGKTRLLTDLSIPTALCRVARVYLDYARDMISLVQDEGQGAVLDPERTRKLAAAYGSASGAVLAYFDALITEDIAKEQGASAEAVRRNVENKEFGYLLAEQARVIAEGKTPNDMVRLAAAAEAYLTGASLVNKYYSLEGREEKGKLVLGAKKALTAQLDQSRKRAREAAARAKAGAGFVPLLSKLEFSRAMAMREGTDQDKLEALQAFWESAFWSELACTAQVSH